MMIFSKIETMELLFHHSMTLLGVPTKVKSKYFVTTLHLFGNEPAIHDWLKQNSSYLPCSHLSHQTVLPHFLPAKYCSEVILSWIFRAKKY